MSLDENQALDLASGNPATDTGRTGFAQGIEGLRGSPTPTQRLATDKAVRERDADIAAGRRAAELAGISHETNLVRAGEERAATEATRGAAADMARANVSTARREAVRTILGNQISNMGATIDFSDKSVAAVLPNFMESLGVDATGNSAKDTAAVQARLLADTTDTLTDPSNATAMSNALDYKNYPRGRDYDPANVATWPESQVRAAVQACAPCTVSTPAWPAPST